MNSDRHLCNFGIQNGRAVIFDNSFIFDTEIPPVISSTYGADEQNNVYEDFLYFLKTSSQEFIDDFIKIFDFLTPTKFNEIMSNVEKKNNIKFEYKIKYNFLYRTNYENLKELLDKYRGEEYAR